MRTPLSPQYVDRIHARLLVRYGVEWLRKWDGIDPAAVKADWANELSGCTAESIAWALDNLPEDKPPSVSQFKRLCVNRPQYAQRELPPPKADKEKVRALLAKARAAITGAGV